MDAEHTNSTPSAGIFPGCVTRYVVWEYFGVFTLTITSMTVVLILALVGKEGISEGLGWGPLLKMTPYVLPVALRFAIPTAVLLATCIIFGRISADNEVVAVKSMGISPSVFLRPALFIGAVTAVVAMFVNDLAVSWGRNGAERVIVESVEEIVYRMLRSQRSYSNEVLSILVRDVQDRRLMRPIVVLKGKDVEDPSIRIEARYAELRTNSDSTMSILLTDSLITKGDKIEFRHPGTREWAISLQDITRGGDDSSSPSRVPLAHIPDALEEQQLMIRQKQSMMAAQAAEHLMVGEFSKLQGSPWDSHQQQLTQAEVRLNKLRLEPWRRYAEGSSCFFFVLMGAPLAIRMRTANFFSTFALCFFPVLLLYYPLLELSVDRAKTGGLPPYSVWIGNLALAAVGMWIMRRVIRH